MKKNLLLSFLLFLLIKNGNAQAPDWGWVHGIGGGGYDWGYGIAADANENIYLTGIFADTVDFDPGAGVTNLTAIGGTDIYVAKFDSAGNFIWAIQVGGIYDDFSRALAIDAGGDICLTGGFQGTVDFDPGPGVFNLTTSTSDEIFVLRISSAGNLVWAKAMDGDIYESGTSIAIDNSGSGDIYTTGYFVGTVDFDPGAGTYNISSGGQDIFISKLDNAGNFVWAKKMGSATSEDIGWDITIDPSGNGAIYTTGTFTETADFDPGPGVFSITCLGGYGDAFISKLDMAGNFIWAKALSGGGDFDDNSYGSTVAVDDSGNIYSAGYYEGTVDFDPGAGTYNLYSGGYDFYISKLTSAGNFVWVKVSMGTGAEITDMVVNPEGNTHIYTTGHFVGTVDFDPGAGVFNLTAPSQSIFISELDGAGNFTWAKDAYGQGYNRARSIALSPIGNILATGSFYAETFTFGTTTLVNADTSGQTGDIYFTKLNGQLGTGTSQIETSIPLICYPNPVRQSVTITNMPFKAGVIKIHDIMGKLKYESIVNNSRATINVSSFSPGIYTIGLIWEDETAFLKFVVE